MSLVRFPSPALKMNILFIMREWLSWWSTTLPRSGSRVRVPSRALLNSKNTSASDVFFSLLRLAPRSRVRIYAPLRSALTKVLWTFSAPSRFYSTPLPDSNEFVSSLRFGRRKANVHRTLCAPSRTCLLPARLEHSRSTLRSGRR